MITTMATVLPRKYCYKQFASIRLLHLYRGTCNSLCGRLENFNLDDKACPKFTTFSYVWGEAQYTSTIQIEGVSFPVLDTVFPLLEALCDYKCFEEDHWIWIDSICINQDDEHERAMQVQLMGRIYCESARTVIWLGEGTDQTARLIGMLRKLARYFQQGHLIQELPVLSTNEMIWDDISLFFRQPWWTRVWTFQEFALPSVLRFHFGRNWIEYHDFYDAMQALYICSQNGVLDGSVWGVAWGRRRVRQLFRVPEVRGRMSLVALLAFTGNYQCTDPRDRIYSLLGLAREADRAIVGQPDYSPKNTVEAVYTKFVINFIEAYGSLDIICFAPLFRPHLASTQTEAGHWPSWIPDWRVEVRPIVVPLMVSQPSRSHIGCFVPLPWQELTDETFAPSYRACGDTKPEVHLNISARTLSCRAVHLGHIDGLATGIVEGIAGDYDQYNFTQSTSPTNTSGKRKSSLKKQSTLPPLLDGDLLDHIMCALTVDRSARYLEYLAPTRRFRDELHQIFLLGETIPIGSLRVGDAQNNALIYRWIEYNKRFLVRGRSLLDLLYGIQARGEGVVATPDPESLPLSQRLLETMSLKLGSTAKVLATLYEGQVGLVPLDAKKGDAVWILKGCSVPVVLRKCAAETYTLVGECYVHGFMDGEAFCEGPGFEFGEVVIA